MLVIPGHRDAMNPESRAEQLEIPGSRFRAARNDGATPAFEGKLL